MKKRKNRLRSRNVVINTSPEIKMSELIGEYASDYINMGESTKERQNYLNAACSAWNIAVFPEQSREAAIRRVVEGYKRLNPGVADVDNLEQNLRTLIRKKLEMFSNIRRIIVGSVIEPITETRYRINIVSTDDREVLKHLLDEGFPK